LKISEFFNNDYVTYAAYDNIRKIASYIDGLKLSSRKVIFTVLKNNINKDEKVNRLAGKVAEKTEYLHGEKSLEGVIVNLAQNFVGSNNLNLLSPEGSFGTRFIPEPGASRYIYTKMMPYLRLIFKEEDEPLLEEQEFEGNKIEYKYFIPIIPLLLVNGSEGISNGFAQKILPRKIDTIINAIENKLNDKDYDLTPGFEGFNGEIVKSENGWEIRGKFEKIGRTTILITELPIGYTLKKYISELDKLEEKKVIKKYKDLSEDDNFKFEITVSTDFMNKSDYDILNTLKLIKKVSENFTSIDENNKIIEFKNEYELFEKYFQIRLKYYTKRKNYLIQKLENEIEFLKDKMLFINSIINNKLIIQKRKKSEIIEDCKNLGIKFYDNHLKMNLLNLTEEKVNELQEEINKKENEIKELKNKTEKDLWIEDLNRLNFLKNYWQKIKIMI